LITFNYFQAFVIGACIGSFLNVIVYRFPNNLSVITPRSFCPKCKKKLTWKENIPLISWLIQRRKCIKCNISISIKYPLVELSTGILFVFFINSSPSIYSSSSGSVLNIFISWIFLSLLICISLIDINKFWIPQGLINFGFISGLLGLISHEIFIDKFIDLFFISKGVFTAAISFLIFECLRYFTKYIFKKDAIGKGDSKLVAMIALWIGPIGTLFAVGFAYIIAAIYCLVGLSANFLKFRQMIPFAPFISIGGLIVWFLGNEFIFDKILHI